MNNQSTKKTAKKPNGVILWEGASLIDGAPIVVIATGTRKASGNVKTGAMIQTFIIRSDIAPHIALRTGDDRSVCGDCPKRPLTFKARSAGDKPCYVDVAKSVRSVYACYTRGNYPRVTPEEAAELFAGRKRDSAPMAIRAPHPMPCGRPSHQRPAAARAISTIGAPPTRAGPLWLWPLLKPSQRPSRRAS